MVFIANINLDALHYVIYPSNEHILLTSCTCSREVCMQVIVNSLQFIVLNFSFKCILTPLNENILRFVKFSTDFSDPKPSGRTKISCLQHVTTFLEKEEICLIHHLEEQYNLKMCIFLWESVILNIWAQCCEVIIKQLNIRCI